MTDLSARPHLIPLPPERLLRRADPGRWPGTSADLTPLAEPLGQPRAVAAVRFAIGMKGAGFNLFALGPEGTGKSSLIRQDLSRAAATRPAPDDWAYVNDFGQPHRPRALRLPAGRAPVLARAMADLIEDLRIAIPAAFDGEEYRSRRQDLESQFGADQDRILSALREHAAEKDIALVRTPVGLALAPVQNGEVLGSDDFRKLPEEVQARVKADLAELQKELEGRLAELPRAARLHRERLHRLDRETGQGVVTHAVAAVAGALGDIPAVTEYLKTVEENVLDHLGDFFEHDEEPQGEGEAPRHSFRKAPADAPAFRRFRVNVLVTGPADAGAPVVYEDQPTQPNLVGRIEHMAHQGALLTDFNLIKAGALHRANGGYLMLDARKVLLNPFAWEELKRALRAREIRIESPGQSMGLFPTVTLEPEPIPLDVKVVLMGDPLLYYILAEQDPEFVELFKVAADFDYEMDRTPDNEMGLARLVGSLAQERSLRPLDGPAIARVIEHASRLAEDAEKLSTHMASMSDLVRESDYWAAEAGAAAIGVAHVERAIAEHNFRHDRVRAHMLEEITRGVVLIDTEGEAIGQANGLVVMTLGQFDFGRPSRITCRAHLGRGDLIDIEREVQLGGPIHSKGVLILSSFLSARFAQDEPLNLAANLVFEQSYGEVEGDSASSAELYCLLSSLADVPIRQSFAVTGSVNQYGQIQAIGGVNEKIEGFFDVCRMRGLTGRQGVVIPASNVPHLMLRRDVVEACAEGRFHVHAVKTVDEGIEILTGLPAGVADKAGQYPPGSINRKVAARLALFSRRARELMQEGGSRRSGRDHD